MKMVDAFATDLPLAGKSPHTIAAYVGDIRRFLGFLHSIRTPVVTEEHVRAYLQQRLAQGRAPASLNRTIAALREYFGYLARNRVIPVNLMARIKTLKTPKPLPKALSHEQVAAIFQAIPSSEPRDRALIGLAYHAGLRVAELVTLTVEDVDLKRGRVMVQRGKGAKGRAVPLNDIVKRALTAYLKIRPAGVTDRFFVSRQHQGLSVSSAQKLFKRYAQKAKVNASIHALRHSVATHMLEKGAPLAFIQDFLGHASITSTVLYSKLTDKRREEVFHQLEMSGAFVG